MQGLHRRRGGFSKSLGVLAAAIAAMSLSATAGAQTTVTWTGTTGNYVDGTNWSSGVTPSNAANEFLEINNGGTANVNPGDAAEGAFLMLGMTPGDTGSLVISAGTMNLGEMRVGGRETIPDGLGGTIANGGGTGSVMQTGGTVNVTFSTGTEPPVESLYIGDSGLTSGNTAIGSYTIKNDAVLLSGIANTDSIVVGTGSGTQGSFTQQDTSIVTSTGFVTVGRSGAVSTYTLSGGTLNVGSGTAASTMNLWLGDGATTDGTAAVAGTSGTFTQSGGAVVALANVEVGRRSGTGIYTMSAGTLGITSSLVLGSNGSATSGAMLSSTGTFNLSGTGAITIGSNLNVGLSSTSVVNTGQGMLNMTGGSINFTNSAAIFAIGNGDGTSGTAAISAGTVNINGATALIDVGRNNGIGLLHVSGTAVVNTNQLTLDSSTGAGAVTRELRIDGGSVNVVLLNMGAVNTPAIRPVNVSGGTLTVSGATTGGRLVTYNLSGGTTNFQGIMSLDTSSLNISSTAAVSFGTFRTQSGITSITGGNTTIANVNDANNEGGTTTIGSGTVNVTGLWNVTNATPATAGTLTISGGTGTINSLTTGGSASLNSLLAISGGSISIPTITLSTGSTLKTDNAISLGSNFFLGNSTMNVNSGSLSLTGNITINASGGRTLTKSGTGTLTISGPQSYVTGSVLTASAGTLNLNSNANGNLTLNANTTTNFGSSQTLGTFNVADGVTATLTAGGSRLLKTTSLNLHTTGSLDLNDNDFIVDYTGTSPLPTTIFPYLVLGRGSGNWNGTSGIRSTSAANEANHATTIGYAEASALGVTSFDNVNVDSTALLLKYTYYGDLNLNGKIDADDYALIDQQVALHGLGSAGSWINGDVNYDGVVNAGDYMLMDTAFGHQTGTLSPDFLAQRQAEFGSDYVNQLVAAVPEPGLFLGSVMYLIMGLPRRRS